MSLSVRGLTEVVLWTRDLKRSLSFYQGLFGLPHITPPEPPHGILKAGDGPGGIPDMIILVPHPDPNVTFPPEKKRRVLHHIALNVEPERYEELRAACEKAGFEVRHGEHGFLKGVRTFYVDDPDGNEVEVITTAN